MPTFITIGYRDQAGYEQTDDSVLESAHAHDARLQSEGVVMGIAGPPVQVRNHDASGVKTTDGAFMRSDLPVAGFAILEAADAEAAARMISARPCAVAQGVVEVWPLRSYG